MGEPERRLRGGKRSFEQLFGFRQELRDSEHYYFEGDVQPELHRGSSNRIGH